MLYLRGRGGRIAFLPLAWKAATRICPGSTSFENALRVFDRGEALCLLMAGTTEVNLVEKVRFEAPAKQVCFNIAGRTIEAIVRLLQLACQRIIEEGEGEAIEQKKYG